MKRLAAGSVLITVVTSLAWTGAPAWAGDATPDSGPLDASDSTVATKARSDSLVVEVPELHERSVRWNSEDAVVALSLAATSIPVAFGVSGIAKSNYWEDDTGNWGLIAFGAIVGPSAGRLLAGGSVWWIVSRALIVGATEGMVSLTSRPRFVCTPSRVPNSCFTPYVDLTPYGIRAFGAALLLADALADVATTPGVVRAHNARKMAAPEHEVSLVPAVSPNTGAAGMALRVTF